MSEHETRPTRIARKQPSVWPAFIAMAAVGFIGWGAWGAAAHSEAKREHERMVRVLSGFGGHQTCKMAWYKARSEAALDGRTPDIYAPEMRVPGPPKVVACAMLKDAKPAEPMLVRVHCPAFDLKCVEPRL